MQFDGQVFIVAGGAGGIGRAAARMLAERGALVLASYFSADGPPADEPGEQIVYAPVDVRDLPSAEALVEAAIARWGRLDGLINCVGLARYAPVESISDAQWSDLMATNLGGVQHMCRAVLRPMMRRRYGRIVNMAALHGVAGGPGQADYSAATGGVLGLTRALAREAAPWSITVNAVVPGLIETEQLRVIPEAQRSWGEQVIALRRVGRPEEAAAAAVFLASPLASYITGAALPVDGGWRMA